MQRQERHFWNELVKWEIMSWVLSVPESQVRMDYWQVRRASLKSDMHRSFRLRSWFSVPPQLNSMAILDNMLALVGCWISLFKWLGMQEWHGMLETHQSNLIKVLQALFPKRPCAIPVEQDGLQCIQFIQHDSRCPPLAWQVLQVRHGHKIHPRHRLLHFNRSSQIE